ncbi:hypothetical protein Y032_0191g1293 [Ancylostoma ceylanicum]|uniref:Uncharacterized protein n=1 Tax=Ancylostoma ceylanicum TaxID=53326 RepID=A0A016SQK5_9BILA|nr:hypothetical protein Y032_0191g1293 [Ancylostoma ceylanicum]
MLFLMISSRPRYIVMVILIQCSSLSAVSLYLYLSPTRAGARATVLRKTSRKMVMTIDGSEYSQYWCIHRLKVGCAVVHYQAYLILIENERFSAHGPSTNTDYRLNGL